MKIIKSVINYLKGIPKLFVGSCISGMLILLVSFPLNFIYISDQTRLLRLFWVGIFLVLFSIIGGLLNRLIPGKYNPLYRDDKETKLAKSKADAKVADFYRTGILALLLIFFIIDTGTSHILILLFFELFAQLYHQFWLRKYDETKYRS